MKNLLMKPVLLNDVEFKVSQAMTSDKEWNWIAPQHGHIEHAANYYESSLADWHQFESLQTDLECDVLVIGGVYSVHLRHYIWLNKVLKPFWLKKSDRERCFRT